MDYTNLKNKTIFDFCNDEKLIAEIIVFDKEYYLKTLNDNPLYNAHDLIEYAEITNNNELLQAVKHQYKKELQAENNE